MLYMAGRCTCGLGIIIKLFFSSFSTILYIRDRCVVHGWKMYVWFGHYHQKFFFNVFQLFYTLETGVFYMAGRCTCGLGIIIKSLFSCFSTIYTLETGVFYMAGRCT